MFSELEIYRAKKIIRELAKANGVSENDIRSEMEQAIDIGFNNTDPSAEAIWKDSPFDGTKPSPEAFILWCAAQIDNE